MLKCRVFWLCGALSSALGASDNAVAGEFSDVDRVAFESSHPAAQHLRFGASGSDSSDAFIKWARLRAIPLQTDESGTSLLHRSDDMAPVRSIVGAARVVALGEPAHGAHEPLAFRNRLFQYLVENLHFTAIALESGLCESKRVQDFLMGGAGEAAQVTLDDLSWGFGKFGENVDLVRWIRAYNDDPKHRHKLRFYGIDLCGGDDAGFPHARIALETVLNYLLRVSPNSLSKARQAIELGIDRFADGRYRSLLPSQQNDFRTAIAELDSFFELDRNHLIALSSPAEYEWVHRSLVVAGALERAFRIWPADEPGKILPADMYKVADVRDAAMADNVRWALHREGSAGRLLVFAHNAHIMNAPVRGGIWEVYAHAPSSMGERLRSRLGKSLLIVGASSQDNAAGLPATTAYRDGIDEALAAVGIDQFLLDLRPARALPRVTAWLQRPHAMPANFTTDLFLSPSQGFDALVFIKRLTPARSYRLGVLGSK